MSATRDAVVVDEPGGRLVFRANQPHKILVVDDSEIVLEVTRLALESAGHHVVTHDRAAGCVALILQEKPDLVLMDVSMPHLAGDTIVGVLGKAQPVGDIVVLLHSSLPADILRVKAQSAGAHGFIQKTSDQFALVREVNRWLKRSGISSGNLRAVTDTGPSASGNGKPHAAAEPGFPSSGSLRTARAQGACSSSTLRVGLDLGAPPNGPPRADLDAWLPSEDDARPSGTARSIEAAVASSTVRRSRPPSVLLVDRDMALLSTYRRYLQADQVTVEYALSGSAALRSITSDNPPDIAVCDAFMSDVSGMELYRRALESAPDWRARMILTSDVPMPMSARVFSEFKGQLLIKPITAEALTRAVRACLAQSSASRAAAT